MNKITLAALALLPFASWAQEAGFTLKGNVKALAVPAKAYLAYKQDNKTLIDSSIVTDGHFQFQGVVDEPIKAQLVLDHTGQGLKSIGRMPDVKTIYLEKGNILVSAEDSLEHATISGSALNDIFERYNVEMAEPLKEMGAVKAVYETATAAQKANKNFVDSLHARFDEKATQLKTLQIAFIKEHPASYASLDALVEVAGTNMDAGELAPVFKRLEAPLQNSKKGQAFAKLLESSMATSVGVAAPDFTQNDVNDKPIKLSDFRGKYVLLDFWASWCGPCRAENPNVVAAFQKYKDRNFTVLGVSLDQPGAKLKWQTAIQEDNLDWTQVSDLQFWDNAVAKIYGIRSIPANFLIDPKGVIVGKNLRGQALQKKLEEVFLE